MKKNILILSSSFKIQGGAEKVAFDIGESLKEKNFNIFYYGFEKSKKEFKSNNMFNLNENLNFIKKFFSIFLYTKNLAKYCRNKNIDTIISHMERPNLIACLVKKYYLKNIKVITTTHNIKYFNKIYFRYLISWLYPIADKSVCVSRTIENELKILFNLKNTTTIYNGFDFKKIDKLLLENILKKDKFLFPDKRDFKIFVNIGRLTKQKGQGFLIRAFKEVVKKYPKSQLLIFSEGELKKDYEKLISQLNLENNIYLMGIRKNIFPYLKNSDFFVFPSLWEGFGLVLVEALYSNLKVISTDCMAGPREILNPKLDINETISYPKINENGILISNFKNKIQINNLIQEKISLNENILSKLMIDLIENKFDFDSRIIKNNLLKFEKEKFINNWIKVIIE